MELNGNRANLEEAGEGLRFALCRRVSLSGQLRACVPMRFSRALRHRVFLCGTFGAALHDIATMICLLGGVHFVVVLRRRVR